MVGVGIDTKTSPRGAAIKKTQDKLRQEYDVLEERIKELEFLQKGGDPLNFKLGHTVSVSVPSTSLTDQQVDQFVASETKGSFPFTASPQGDSVESSGRPGSSQPCEPNSADNPNLFNGENKFIEGERTFRCVRNNIALQAKSTQMAGTHNVKELGDSVALGVPRKAYKRRYRTRPSRDGAKSNSNDVHTCGGPSYSVTNDSKGLLFDLEKQWSRNITGQTTSSNGVVTSKAVLSNNHYMVELDTMKAAKPVNEMEKVCQPNYVSDIVFSMDLINSQIDQRSVGVCQESPTEMALEGSELLSVKEKGGFGGLETQLSHMEKVDDQASSRQMYGSSNAKSDMKTISNDHKRISAALASKVLDSASSCTQASLSLNGKKDTEFCIDPRDIDSTGHLKDQTPIAERNCVLENNVVKLVKDIKTDGICGFVREECSSVQKNHKESGFGPELVDLIRNESTLQSEIKDEVVTCKESISPAVLKTEVIQSFFVSVNSNIQDNNVCSDLGSFDSSVPYHTKDAEIVGISSAFYVGPQSEIKINLVTRGDEDSILEEAQIIEEKRKRIIELSSVNTLIESCCKSHWDFVLEEMPWMANDFVQERLWKISSASRVSYHAATTSQLWFQEINDSWKHKKLSHTLVKAVTEFWQSVKWQGMNKKAELQSPKKDSGHTIKEYAVEFLKYNNFDVPDSLNQAPVTPEIEDNLFYTVSPGAAETYRKAIESQVLQYEKIRSKVQEGLETSAYYAYEEDERELTMHDMPVAFCRSNSSRFSQKRKLYMNAYSGRSYAIVADLSFTECKENKVGSQRSKPHRKCPTTSLNVSFPRNCVRTCYGSSVLSPFNAGTSSLQVSPKTDASSETSSFQDDQSILHGGSLVPNSVEVESVGNFEKRLKCDSSEVSMKPKKKKVKYPGSSYEQRWLPDSNFQIEQFQGDYSRKRLEHHQFESNGCNGINRIINQHIPKKPKIMRPSLETSSEYNSPITGSAPSPSASQFSNMPNTNKFTRMLTGRDLSKKAKSLKMPAGLAGSGSQWSPFEDQALVVLVHDMGPNWELVSDAINSTLDFKCIYRKPMECKEHHKILMVKNVNGADSTEESEETRSSQPYPSTLPGIPKGSARQLFQRLLGPVEEATCKSHFEKIILIGQKYLFGKTQGKQDPKQLQQPHSSHTNALSQVVPNYLNGIILTPLDLCDAPSSSLDISSLGFQNPHSSGLPVSNQGLGPMSPSGAISATVQGSLNVIHGNDFSSPSSTLNATVSYFAELKWLLLNFLTELAIIVW
ncbi:unnamed protein product [Cuscuta campestris]|uniref:Myb-like domain-containing protein n=1 Tax=Cuscuta campestris TaxID=132261 RepID=A0A484N7H9_9ASTE|nr:unnamed protein product [Cuscuta campestris]